MREAVADALRLWQPSFMIIVRAHTAARPRTSCARWLIRVYLLGDARGHRLPDVSTSPYFFPPQVGNPDRPNLRYSVRHKELCAQQSGERTQQERGACCALFVLCRP